jgi:hypothetical protein
MGHLDVERTISEEAPRACLAEGLDQRLGQGWGSTGWHGTH